MERKKCFTRTSNASKTGDPAAGHEKICSMFDVHSLSTASERRRGRCRVAIRRESFADQSACATAGCKCVMGKISKKGNLYCLFPFQFSHKITSIFSKISNEMFGQEADVNNYLRPWAPFTTVLRLSSSWTTDGFVTTAVTSPKSEEQRETFFLSTLDLSVPERQDERSDTRSAARHTWPRNRELWRSILQPALIIKCQLTSQAD